jgi:hypothetical protein
VLQAILGCSSLLFFATHPTMGDNVSVASTAADPNSERQLDSVPKEPSYESDVKSAGGDATPNRPMSEVEKGTPPPTLAPNDDPYLVRLLPTDPEHPYVCTYPAS